MTSLTTNSDPTAPPTTGSVQAPADEPILITEQQVLWGTAVARFGRTPKPPKPAAPRPVPKRHAWLETALMAREMDRL
ncbi:hypothetical protein [Mycolicibacterium pulveris]|uniref:hypothetical protein n=1 Tax=Mycolicibacterium pulveris TaxID=36813 RepID=UPI003CED2A6E